MPSQTPPFGNMRHLPMHGGTKSPSSPTSSSPTTNSMGSLVLSSLITRPSLVLARPMRVSFRDTFIRSFAIRKCAVTELKSVATGVPFLPSRSTRSSARPSPSRSSYSPTSSNSTSMLSVPLGSATGSKHNSSGKHRICSACLRWAAARISSGTSLNIAALAGDSPSHFATQRSMQLSTEGPKVYLATSNLPSSCICKVLTAEFQALKTPPQASSTTNRTGSAGF
mmetsp:Transcript_64885/g.186442  ORF Transcript_64885/g.186442 Transcript_64885/m.186442 type:complete len:225 (-) Transcript_64885:144-818(-)